MLVLAQVQGIYSASLEGIEPIPNTDNTLVDKAQSAPSDEVDDTINEPLATSLAETNAENANHEVGANEVKPATQPSIAPAETPNTSNNPKLNESAPLLNEADRRQQLYLELDIYHTHLTKLFDFFAKANLDKLDIAEPIAKTQAEIDELAPVPTLNENHVDTAKKELELTNEPLATQATNESKDKGVADADKTSKNDLSAQFNDAEAENLRVRLVAAISQAKLKFANFEQAYTMRDSLTLVELEEHLATLKAISHELTELYQTLKGKSQGSDFATRGSVWQQGQAPHLWHPRNREEDAEWDKMDRLFYYANDKNMNKGGGLWATINNFSIERLDYNIDTITFRLTFNKDHGVWDGGGLDAWRRGRVDLYLPVSIENLPKVTITEQIFYGNEGSYEDTSALPPGPRDIMRKNNKNSSEMEWHPNSVRPVVDSNLNAHYEIDKNTTFYKEYKWYFFDRISHEPTDDLALKNMNYFINTGKIRSMVRFVRPLKHQKMVLTITIPYEKDLNIAPQNVPIGLTYSNVRGGYQRCIFSAPFGYRFPIELKVPQKPIFVRNREDMTDEERDLVKRTVYDSTLHDLQGKPNHEQKQEIIKHLTDAYNGRRGFDDFNDFEAHCANYMNVRKNGDVAIKFADKTWRFLHNDGKPYYFGAEDHRAPIIDAVDERNVLENRKFTDAANDKSQESYEIEPITVVAYDKEEQFKNATSSNPSAEQGFKALRYLGYTHPDELPGSNFHKNEFPNGLGMEIIKKIEHTYTDIYHSTPQKSTGYQTVIRGKIKGINWKKGETEKVYKLKFRSEDKWFHPDEVGTDGDYKGNYAEKEIRIVVKKNFEVIPVGVSNQQASAWQALNLLALISLGYVLSKRLKAEHYANQLRGGR